jgi:hypothetical protein
MSAWHIYTTETTLRKVPISNVVNGAVAEMAGRLTSPGMRPRRGGAPPSWPWAIALFPGSAYVVGDHWPLPTGVGDSPVAPA